MGIYNKENKWRGTQGDTNKTWINRKKKWRTFHNVKLGEENGTNNTKERPYILRKVNQFNHNEKSQFWQLILAKNRNWLAKFNFEVLSDLYYHISLQCQCLIFNFSVLKCTQLESTILFQLSSSMVISESDFSFSHLAYFVIRVLQG